jgi:hypothetical protein
MVAMGQAAMLTALTDARESRTGLSQVVFQKSCFWQPDIVSSLETVSNIMVKTTGEVLELTLHGINITETILSATVHAVESHPASIWRLASFETRTVSRFILSRLYDDLNPSTVGVVVDNIYKSRASLVDAGAQLSGNVFPASAKFALATSEESKMKSAWVSCTPNVEVNSGTFSVSSAHDKSFVLDLQTTSTLRVTSAGSNAGKLRDSIEDLYWTCWYVNDPKIQYDSPSKGYSTLAMGSQAALSDYFMVLKELKNIPARATATLGTVSQTSYCKGSTLKRNCISLGTYAIIKSILKEEPDLGLGRFCLSDATSSQFQFERNGVLEIENLDSQGVQYETNIEYVPKIARVSFGHHERKDMTAMQGLNVLLLGGSGSLGSLAAAWLAESGAGSVTLGSRSAAVAEIVMDITKSKCILIKSIKSNAALMDDAYALICEAGSVGWFLHAGGTLADGLYNKLAIKQFWQVSCLL